MSFSCFLASCLEKSRSVLCLLGAIRDRFERRDSQMDAAGRIVKESSNHFSRVLVGKASERSAIVFVREKPWIAKLPKSSPDCPLSVWWQHAGVAICSNSIGVTLDIILGEVTEACTSTRRKGLGVRKLASRQSRISAPSLDQLEGRSAIRLDRSSAAKNSATVR